MLPSIFGNFNTNTSDDGAGEQTVIPPTRPGAPPPAMMLGANLSTPQLPPPPNSAKVRPMVYAAGPDRPLQLFRLEDFDLLRTLGTGTFGRVQLARYRGFEKYFAMKVLRKSEVVRLNQVDHVYSERALLGRLNHPFIIKL